MKISRRKVLKTGLAAGIGSVLPFGSSQAQTSTSPPNILFISVDDLNDWISPLGGYPGVLTPNFERLANMSRTYLNAQSSIPACNPSRTSALYGVQPFRSGFYENNGQLRSDSPSLMANPTLPAFFKAQGYRTMGTGKIFHGNYHQSAWHEYLCDPYGDNELTACSMPVNPTASSNSNQVTFVGDNGPIDEDGKRILLSQTAIETGGKMDFGAYPELMTQQMPDMVRAKWVAEKLKSSQTDPFFLACGFYKPHLPFMVPAKYFARYNRDNLSYPEGAIDFMSQVGQLENASDLQDLPTAGRILSEKTRDLHEAILKKGEWKKVIHSYLACISFIDDCLGVLLNALETGPHNNNTIIVLWSDHGWQLGEKLAWKKFTLWERALRVPVMISIPPSLSGLSSRQPSTSRMPISLIDLYPTLTDLACNTIPQNLDGHSMKNHLMNNVVTHNFALSTWSTGATVPRQVHLSIKTPEYRYIRYESGGKELYFHNQENGIYEIENLVSNGMSSKDRIVMETLDSMLPRPHEINKVQS